MKIYFTICFYSVILLACNINYLFAVDTVDVKPPMIYIQEYCGEYVINVTELRNFSINKDTFQLDCGIRDTVNFYTKYSNNFYPPVIDTNTFHKGKLNYDFSFKMSVIDKFKNAEGVFVVMDTIGKYDQEHIVFKKIFYYPESLEIIPNILQFGEIYVDSSSVRDLVFKNTSDSVFAIKEIGLKYGKSYKIIDSPKTPFPFKQDSSIKLKIIYSPKKEILDLYEPDTLYIKTECLVYKIPLFGRGVEPRIEADDFDFDIVEVGTSKEKLKINFPGTTDGLEIWDRGSGILRLSGYRYNPEDSPFKFSCPDADPSPNNMSIQPNSPPIPIKGLCFKPLSAGEFFGEIIFSSNAKGPDSISSFRGIGFDKGPYITSLNFGERRVGSENIGNLVIRNTGDSPWGLSGFEFENNNGDFKILWDSMALKPSPENPVIIFPITRKNVLTEYIIPIQFIPKSENFKEVKIFPLFIKDNISQRINLFNYIRGFGILPKNEVYGYNFAAQTLVNVKHPDTGKVLIKSTSSTADLRIKSIDTIQYSNPNVQDFTILMSLPKDTIIRRGTTFEIPITFKPEESGLRKIDFRIITDAVSGNFDGSVWDTIYVTVAGYGYNKVLEVVPLRFENAIHCDTTYGVLMVKNISNRSPDTTTAYMFNVLLESGDVKAFYIDNEYVYQKFVFLKPGDSIGFPVKFMPFNYDTTSLSALARVYSDVDTSITIIKGTSKRYDVQVKMDTTYTGIPGMYTIDKLPEYDGVDYPVYIQSDYLNKLYIDSFYIELKFKSNELKFANIVEKGTAIKDWPDTYFRFVEKVLDSKYSLLKISASGYSPIDSSGSLIIPGFLIMLGDTNGISIDIQNVTFFSSNKCIDIKPTDGLMKLSFCGANIRKIIISKTKYDVKILSSIPVTSNSLTLSYSIGITANTNIRMYNSYGELIKTICDEYKSEGTYNSDLDINDLSSGIYFITINSGPYINKIKFVVNK